MRNETLKNYKSYLGSMITAYLRLMVVTPVLCICVEKGKPKLLNKPDPEQGHA